jgi:threonine synthase
MVAAEVFGSLENALQKGLDYTEAMPTGPTVGISVGVANSAYQSLLTIKESDGAAMRASDEEMLEAQMDLAAEEGLYVEASAALALAVAKRMRKQGQIKESDVVVVLSTSGGLKDPSVTQRMLPEIPVIQPTDEALREAMRHVYGSDLNTVAAHNA